VSFEPAIKTFLDHLNVERGYSENTLLAYGRDLRLFAQHCTENGENSPDEVTPDTASLFTTFLAKRRKYVASSAQRSLAAARTFLKFLVTEGALKTDPGAHCERPKQWKRLPHVLSAETTAALTEAPKPEKLKGTQRKLAIRDRAILELLYATGMRVSELCRVRMQDLDPREAVVRVTGKGEKTRLIPVGRTALATVNEYVVHVRHYWAGPQDENKIFLSRGHKPMAREDVWALVKRAGKSAGIAGKYSPHTLRHSFATHLLEGGANLRAVQEMLGHANVTTTEIYTHVDAKRLTAVHRKFHPRG
jgi:integrase/recombinase XerD